MNELHKEHLEELNLKFLNRTVYHKKYDEGVIVRIDDVDSSGRNAHFFVKFHNDGKEIMFSYPMCIEEGFLSFDPPKLFHEMDYKEREKAKEEDYLNKVIDVCNTERDRKINVETVSASRYMDSDESFDPQELENEIAANTHTSLWNDIANSPFFASVDCVKDGLFYIGKREIKNYVIPWKDKRANMYYDYQMLINDRVYGLRLVRDHDIRLRRYIDFVDKLNTFSSSNENGINIDKLTDSYLIKLLEYSRQNKKTHEIIQTIQANQYKIISDMHSNNILVRGCAGSGKTMVLFHRIAYIAFNDDDFKGSKNCIISTNRLLNIEAIALSKELDITSVKNMSIYELYQHVLKQYAKENNCAVIVNDKFDEQVSNPKFYQDNFLNEVCSNVRYIVNKGLSGEKYIDYKKKDLTIKFNYLTGAKLEETSESFDYIYEHFFDDESECKKQFTVIDDLMSEIRIVNIKKMSENGQLNEHEMRICNLLEKQFPNQINLNPKYSETLPSVLELKNVIDLYLDLAKSTNQNYHSLFEPHLRGEPSAVVFFDYVKLSNEFDTFKKHLINIVNKIEFVDEYEKLSTEINSTFGFLLFEQNDFVDVSKEQSLKWVNNTINYQNSDNYSFNSAFDLSIKFSSKYLATIYDCLKFETQIKYILNISKDVPYENVEATLYQGKYSIIVSALKPICSGEAVYDDKIDEFQKLVALLNKTEEKPSIFNQELIMPSALADYYDCLFYEKNFEEPLYEFSVTIPRRNFYAFKKNSARGFVSRYLDGCFENDKSVLTGSGTIALEDEDVKRFVKNVEVGNNVNSLYDGRINNKEHLIKLLDGFLFKKEMRNLSHFISNDVFQGLLIDIINYVVEGRINDYDKAFLYAYVINKFTDYVLQFDHIYVDEYQNYSKNELSLIKSLCPKASIDLFGDYYQKVESKGTSSESEIPFKIDSFYELNVNYRNAKEICEYLNEKYDKKMITIGIHGTIKNMSKDSPIDLTDSEDGDRTVVIVQNIDLINDLKFADEKSLNLVSSNSGEIKKDAINVCSIFDVRGLEFERVFLYEKGMNNNEKYLGASRALRDLIVIK